MEEHKVESNSNIMNLLMFVEYCLMREGLPDHVACIECRGSASTLLVGCVMGRDHLRARMVTFEFI
jgi:hypothetical protein